MQLNLKITVSQTPSQNEIKHYWKLNKQTLKYREELKNYGFLLKQKGIDSNAKRKLKITRFSTKTLDYGNLVGGCKPLLDAMKFNNLIIDDSPKWLDDKYLQEKCNEGKERTEIEVEG
jgi:hypothetical protein